MDGVSSGHSENEKNAIIQTQQTIQASNVLPLTQRPQRICSTVHCCDCTVNCYQNVV